MPQLMHLQPGTRFRQPDLDITGTLLMANECRARVRLDRGSTLVEFAASDGETRVFAARRQIETSWASTVFVEALSFCPLPERQTTMTTKTKKSSSAKKTAAESSTPLARTRPGKKRGAAPESPTTVNTDGNLTIVEVPSAEVTTIDGTAPSPRKASNARKTGTPKPEPKAKPANPAAASGSLSQLDAAVEVLTKSKEPMNTKQMVDAMAAQGLWSSPGGKTPHATLYSAILRELQAKGDGARFLKVDRGHFSLRK